MARSNITAPDAVAVHCDVGVRIDPYSNGKRYCRSAVQKCEEVTAIARFTVLESISREESSSPSAIVEHAPYSPNSGIPVFLCANEEPMH